MIINKHIKKKPKKKNQKKKFASQPLQGHQLSPAAMVQPFVDTLLQPISKIRKSYLKDITDFINFIENTKVKKRTFLVSMDVTSLYTNIPQNEGIEIVCKAYENFYKDNPPIPTHYLREMLRLILKENSFQFNGKHYLQTHGTAMGTKTAVSFANIFMAHIETTILSRTVFKPTVWKRYIDDIFSLWDISKPDIEAFIEQHHYITQLSNSRPKYLTLRLCF